MNESQTATSPAGIIFNGLSILFGLLAFAIGIVNTFWGNDPGFGIFIIVLSSIFFPPVTALIREKTGRRIPGYLKILLALFILWAALGVGELFDKIRLMVIDLRS
ncbi:hypothetical protein WBG78_09305 [Chryseolinea sp. T2]|uniref:hypothetical protein n=1 Tax=Chryseolinea sp. T2 TaxID=3129255 RepID=UPI003077F67D